MKLLALAAAALLVVTLSGCIAGTDDTPEIAEPTDDVMLDLSAPIIEEFTGSTGISVATPMISLSNGGAYEFALNQEHENTTGWIIEVTWDAAGPETQQLDLWIRDNGDYAVVPEDPTETDRLTQNQPKVKATGASPLRLTLTPDQLDEGVGYNMLVRAATPAGAANDQAFAIHVATFVGIAMHESHEFA